MDYTAGFESLANKAAFGSKQAHVPNTGYRVGAAILMVNGTVFVGCNVEVGCTLNTLHAEICTIGSMIVLGYQPQYAVAMAVYTDEEEPCGPCGSCRQSIYELFPKDFKIITCNNDGIHKVYTQEEMLPDGYHRRRSKK